MTYWPSYSEISSAARTAYVDWLASGRRPGAHIGYVFLFFYGIERRVLVDAMHRFRQNSGLDPDRGPLVGPESDPLRI